MGAAGRAVLTGLVMAVLTVAGAGQQRPFWGSLEPGPHAVGFESRWVRDPGRRYSTILPDGSPWPADGRPGPRPVLVNTWYPARGDGVGTSRSAADGGRGEAMRHGDYLDIVPRPDERHAADLVPYARALAAHALDVLLGELSYAREGVDEGERRAWLAELLTTPVPSRRGAAPAAGAFPVVLYHSGAGSSFEDNAVLCELLASHGFVVMGSAYPKLDGSGFNVDTGDGSFRDLELLLREAAARPAADATRVAMIGHSAGAHTTFRFATLPGNPLDAAVALDTTQDAHPLDDPRWAPFVEPTLAGAEHLAATLMVVTNPHAVFLLADRLDGVDRYLYTWAGFDHNDYILQGIQCAESWGRREGDPAPAARLRAGYDQLCRDIVTFLRAELGDDAEARAVLDELHRDGAPGGDGPHIVCVPRGTSGPPTLGESQTAADLPPTPRQLQRLVVDQGAGATLSLLARWAERSPRPPLFHPDTLWVALDAAWSAGQQDEARALWAGLSAWVPEVLTRRVSVARFYAESNPERYQVLLRDTLERARALEPDVERWAAELADLGGHDAVGPAADAGAARTSGGGAR